jgi:hypothetical protein
VVSKLEGNLNNKFKYIYLNMNKAVPA